eukprot:s549_g8.t1
MDKEVRFLGAELWRKDDGTWILTQSNYIKDLLKRNLGGDESQWPTRKIPMIKEPEITGEGETCTPANVKEAQRVIGELVWITARTRPDLSFAVSKLASMITKAPEQVFQLVKHIWFYLASTMDHGLLFQNQRNERQLNIYTDASYSDVSFGCHLVLWGSSLLLWKAGKQPIQAASTAESELVEVLEGALAGDAVKVVLEEALDVCSRSFSFTDSSAALAIIAGDSGSWRTRHLRKRANILRVKVLTAEWMLRHVPGVDMPADLGTKVLTAQKFLQHKKAMGMFVEELERERNLEHGGGGGSSKEAKEKALKMIILTTQMAMPRASIQEGSHQELTIWESSVERWKRPESSFFMIAFVAVIFAVGVFLGVCVMGIFFWHRVDKMIVVKYKNSMVPAFLYKVFEKEEPEVRRPAHLDARTATSSADGMVSAAATSMNQSTAGAVRAGGSSSAARSAAGAMQTGPLSAAGAGQADGVDAGGVKRRSSAARSAAGAGHADSSNAAGAGRAGSLSSAGAGSHSTSTAGAAAAASTAGAASADGAEVRAGIRNRMQGAEQAPSPLYTTIFGGKYHSDRQCRGLRHASEICLTPRCPRCGPAADIPHYQLWAISHGYELHTSYEHCRDYGSNGPLRLFRP